MALILNPRMERKRLAEVEKAQALPVGASEADGGGEGLPIPESKERARQADAVPV